MLLIDAQRQDPHSRHLLSTHGVGVMEAIELARIAHPEKVAQRIFIVGITIQSAGRGSRDLSPATAEAVPRAAALVSELAKSG
jgi:hydrogenase maturation protease